MTEMRRRTFLGAAAGAAAAMGARAVRAQTSMPSGSPPIRVGLIGCGGYGGVLLDAAHRVGSVEVAALCDVDRRHLAATADKVESLQGRRPREFKLYDEMLAAGGLDAVFIATPPHWHALQFLAALDAGLHIYCEKPLAYDIRECQAMAQAAAARPDQVVQIGFQRRQSPAFAQTLEAIRAGRIGRVLQVDVQIHYTAGVGDTAPQEPPPELDWDIWCGPSPKLPYSPQIGHKSWRLEKETGHGHLVDWGIHLIDATRRLLGAGIPRRVAASGGWVRFGGKITTPDTLTATFDFDGVPVVWRHRIWGAQEFYPDTANGVFLFGEDGTIFVTDQRWVLRPKHKSAEPIATEAKADLAGEHMAEFLLAVRERRPAGCPPAEGLASTAAVKLAMIAFDLGCEVEWNASAGEAVGDDARARMKREYRAPWRHPWTG